MADFTDQEKETLDKLRKAFEAQGKTRLVLDPWQEHISRDATVNAAKAGLAAKVIEGMSGSWAAQYKYSWGSRVAPNAIGTPPEPIEGIDPLGPPVPIRSKTHHLGKRGPPEINFVPYNWRTNTFGSKGPSLVGHPISFEVVGPTLKSPFTDWTWDVVQGAGANGGDLLSVGVRPDGAPSTVFTTVLGTYGPSSTAVPATPWTIGDAAEPNGGLYLIVTDDGVNPGSLDTGGGQVPMGALSNFTDTARYEVFRISAITDFTIEIHPNKSFGRFFDLPLLSTRSIRALTIIRPYVTRLAAIPQSGAPGGNDGQSTSGREQVFVTVSPERAAGNDNFPPYDSAVGPGSGDGTWIGGGFTNSRAPFGTPIGGEPAAYGAGVRLPIPIPVREAVANVEATALTPTALVGNWTLIVSDATIYSAAPLFSSWFPIVRINATARSDDLSDLTLGSIPNCLGWFDVVDTTVGPDTVVLARVPETDPQTGLTYWGPGPWEANIISPNVAVGFTFHEPVEALWYGNFRVDKVESARLKNLINPNWVERFEKQLSDPLLAGGGPPPPGGSTAGRPDKAIFDTRRFFGAAPIPEAANPGNLMDLGFRMVLFPAKEDDNDATLAVPDFDRPIMGRELTIDGSIITEKQFLEVDYSSGIVRLSVPPPTSRAGIPDEPSDVIPNGIPGTSNNNTRGEVILYGACVPYSMEESQLGTGTRVTANRGDGLRDFDLYGEQVFAKIMFDSTFPGATTFTVTSPFIGPSVDAGADAIVLDRIWDGPETGVIVITTGSENSQSLGRWGYTEKVTITSGGASRTALLGISAFPTALNPDPSLFAGEQTRGVVLRREVFFGTETFSLPAVTDFYVGDTTYGSEARAQTLRFERAKVLPEIDGSLTVRPRADLAAQLDRTTGHIQPSKLRLPSDTITNPAPTLTGFLYFAEDGIYKGLAYQADAGHAAGTNPGFLYDQKVVGPGPGANLGPSMAIQIRSVGAVAFAGIVTQDDGVPVGTGSFVTANNFRFVAKVGIDVRNPATTAKGFIGMVQDESGGGVTPTVSIIPDPATLFPTFSVIGFQFDLGATTTWRYWTRGAGNPDNILPVVGTSASAVVLTFQGPYYFVIETNRIDVNDLDSQIVKMGVYDGEKNLIESITVTHTDQLPIPNGKGLFTAAGLRETPGTPTGVDLSIFSIKVILDTEIDDLPPLP